MPTIAQSTYQGGLRVHSTHEKSGVELITDAPEDNRGQGRSFSPTDLFCVSLANCMLTIMGIYATDRGVELGAVTIDIEKTMASNPRRIEKIGLTFRVPAVELSDETKKGLKKAARTCPVARSVHPDIELEEEWIWNV